MLTLDVEVMILRYHNQILEEISNCSIYIQTTEQNHHEQLFHSDEKPKMRVVCIPAFLGLVRGVLKVSASGERFYVREIHVYAS